MYGVLPSPGESFNKNYNTRGSLSLVTGSHAMKTGFSTVWDTTSPTNAIGPNNVVYRFTNGVPNTIVEYADLRCPYCQQFELDSMPTLINQVIKTGEAKLVFRTLTILAQSSPSAAPSTVVAISSVMRLNWNFPGSRSVLGVKKLTVCPSAWTPASVLLAA